MDSATLLLVRVNVVPALYILLSLIAAPLVDSLRVDLSGTYTPCDAVCVAEPSFGVNVTLTLAKPAAFAVTSAWNFMLDDVSGTTDIRVDLSVSHENWSFVTSPPTVRPDTSALNVYLLPSSPIL